MNHRHLLHLLLLLAGAWQYQSVYVLLVLSLVFLRDWGRILPYNERFKVASLIFWGIFFLREITAKYA